MTSAITSSRLPGPDWLLCGLVALRAVSLRGQGGAELWRMGDELGYDSPEALSGRIKRLTGEPPRKLSAEDFLEFLRDRCRPGESRG